MQWPYAIYRTDCIKYIQNSVYWGICSHIEVYAVICKHMQHYEGIFTHIEALLRHIQAYSAPCVCLTYPQPYQALAYLEPQAYSKPCETVTWQIRNCVIVGIFFTFFIYKKTIFFCQSFNFNIMPFIKWNNYFPAREQKFAKFFMSFWKTQATFPSDFASIFSAIKHNLSVLFLSQTLYALVKSSPIKSKFLRFSSVQVKICQIPHVSFELTSQFLFKFCIIHCHDK